VRSLVELRFEDDALAQSFVARIPDLQARHRALGLTDEESRATIEALPRHVALHRACGGDPGGWEVEWIEMIWAGRLSELGRLQFEDHGDGVLDVHIPETGSPLDPTACDASFERAREVYPSHHSAQCTSWLLDPQLAEALPRASNIVRFQHRFGLRDEGREANDDVLRFVFHTYEPDLDRLIPRTTLERALVERMREGGTWRAPTGVTSLR
jgi:GNAT domain-containint protein/N-acyltransferase family protein